MNIRDRLVQCFLAVFPDLSAEQVQSASRDVVAAWDSLAGITLLAVVQEEFGVEIDMLEWGELTSFPAVLGHLEPLQAEAS